MTRAARTMGQWCRATSRASVAMEFALAMLILPTLIFGVYDATQALKTWQRMALAADAIAAMAGNCTATNYLNGAPVPGNPGTCIGGPVQNPPNNPTPANLMFSGDAQTIMKSIYAYFPNWQNGGSPYSVTLSAASFANSGSAQVQWSTSLAGGNTRCGTLTPDSNYESDPFSTQKHTMPQGVFPANPSAANPLLIADITYTYNSWFSHLFGNIAMSRSAFLPMRIGSPTTPVTYQGGGNAC